MKFFRISPIAALLIVLTTGVCEAQTATCTNWTVFNSVDHRFIDVNGVFKSIMAPNTRLVFLPRIWPSRNSTTRPC
jgi:hypothetical protein